MIGIYTTVGEITVGGVLASPSLAYGVFSG
jgi:hypothetical protein